MKIIYKGLIAPLMLLMVLLTPIKSLAQEEASLETSSQVSLEVARESQESSQQSAQLPDWIAVCLFLILIIGIPTLFSYGLRLYFQNNLLAYAGTYVFILMCYVLSNAFIEDMPAGDPLMIGLALLIPSMIGSVGGQTIYLLRIPK